MSACGLVNLSWGVTPKAKCGAPQHEGRCQKPLTLFGAGYLLPPSRQGAGVGATFALMSLFNNKTQNILALMHVFIVSCS